ncbi:MAG: hypothetical protein LBG11_11800 [Bifidobacteriaceae bacterium]|nr:hypothetical protein [Bifidobacteriaceae bacterium]
MTARDRCDRCGARSYFRATLMSGELFFCAHHGRELMPVLSQQALQVDDYTAELTTADA